MFVEIQCPPYKGELGPYSHLVDGTRIYVVNWELYYPEVELKCCNSACTGCLIPTRNSFAKHKGLLPIFNPDRPPDWVIVMKYQCPRCKMNVVGNDGCILQQLPEYIKRKYPVYPRYAQGQWHLSRTAADLFEEVMMTYGNGDLVARMFFQAINKLYISRLEDYLSYHAHTGGKCQPYPDKDSEYIKYSLPTGTSLRDLYEKVSTSHDNYGGVSDKMRHTREIQSVTANIMFAQDHTHEVVKNYQSILGAFACWDCATETGEIASAVLVPSTKAIDYAHAAEALARRPGFNPQVMYADTWPHGKDFWDLLFGKRITGRLGLFHYSQRIMKTLRNTHCDFRKAVWELSMCIYALDEDDLAKVYKGLRDGTLDGRCYTTKHVENMKHDGSFRKKFFRFIRKRIRPPDVIRTMLDTWFCDYKVEASDPVNNPGRGRLDKGKKLFTPDTKDAIKNCKEKAEFLQDPPNTDMYISIEPPETKKIWNLTEYLSMRGESRLEGFHDPLANFGNTGMTPPLCDCLNLAGTARYNLVIRHKRGLTKLPQSERGKISQYFEQVPPFWNHTQLDFINQLATKVGWEKQPFPQARPLPKDNGERFFAEYFVELCNRRKKYKDNTINDRCPCERCFRNIAKLPHDNSETVQPPRQMTVAATEPSQSRKRPQRETTTVPPISTMRTEPNVTLDHHIAQRSFYPVPNIPMHAYPNMMARAPPYYLPPYFPTWTPNYPVPQPIPVPNYPVTVTNPNKKRKHDTPETESSP